MLKYIKREKFENKFFFRGFLWRENNILKISSNFVKFLFIGGLNTVVCMLLFWFLVKVKLNYLFSSALMNVFGVIEGYILNAKLLYKTKIKVRGLLRYFNIYAIAFILNLLLMFSFVSLLALPKLMAQIFTIGLLTMLNYQMVKLFVFKAAEAKR